VDRIREVRVEVELSNRRADFQESYIPRILTNEGSELDLPMSPATVMATVPIQQNFFTKEVPVMADVVTSSLATGYEIRSISISPATVTLSGDRASIDRAGDYLTTAAISLDKALDQLITQVPLTTPEGVRVLGENGEPMLVVQVKVDIAPVGSYLVVEKSIELRNLPEDMQGVLSQERVTVLIIGPKPLLDEIQAAQDLVVIYLDAGGLGVGTFTVPLLIEAPPELQAMVFPEEVQLILSK
jgi:YbbR domain-containing protein